MNYEVLQTEKAYRSQQTNTFIIVFKDYQRPTKIQVAQMLKQGGFHPLNINKAVPARKIKSRGGRRNTVQVKRPTKYYVTLAQGETLVQESQNDQVA